MKTKDPGNVVKVDVHHLIPGMYVDLELNWMEHPFFFRKFKIRSQQDIDTIKELGIKKISVFPQLSTVSLADVKAQQQKSVESELGSALSSLQVEQLWTEKKQHIDQANTYRQQRRKAQTQYQETVKKVRGLVQDMRNAPANALSDASDIVNQLSESFAADSDLMVNLINLSYSSFSFYSHSLNVTMLSMLLAKNLGASHEEIKDVGLGAILHDIGKAMVPGKVLIAQSKRELNAAETNLLNSHSKMGLMLAQKVENLSPKVLDIIGRHHEMLDGSGYPDKLKDNEISRAVRIVAVANMYDNLCNPPNPAAAMTPKDAMATLFKEFKGRLDSSLVQRFIQSMGIYPPGTVIKLSDESVGLVVAVSPDNLLRPIVLLYNPDIPKRDALCINLSEHEELTVQTVLKPGTYPQRIYDYLGIQERVGYFCDSPVS